LDLTFGDGGLIQTNQSDLVVIKGGLGTKDKVTISANSDDTGAFTMTGVETMVFGVDTAASTLNLKNVTGLTGITVTDDGGTANKATITNAPIGIPIDIGVAGGADFGESAALIDYNITTNTGSSDSVTFNLVKTTGVDLDTDGIETVNLVAKEASAGAIDTVSIAASSVTAGTINVSGADADDDVLLDSIASGYTTVSATGLKGDLTIAASARPSSKMTITGGSGADDIAMESALDVLDGGSGSDTLTVSGTFGSGGVTVDLTATDNISTFNGASNGAVQTGFESVSLAAYTQVSSVGSTMTGTTGANTLTGSAYNDVISGNGGADTINGGDGADTLTNTGGTINGDAGADTITIGTGSAAITVNGGADNDTISGAAATGVTPIIDGGTGSDTITLGTGTYAVQFNHANAEGADTVTGFTSDDVIKLLGIGTNDAEKFSLHSTTYSNSTHLSTSGITIALADNKLLLAEVAIAATVDTAAEIIAADNDIAILDGLDVVASADAWILIGGANDDTTQYLYKVDNNSDGGSQGLVTDEVVLIATITSNITNGIAGYVANDFDFT